MAIYPTITRRIAFGTLFSVSLYALSLALHPHSTARTTTKNDYTLTLLREPMLEGASDKDKESMSFVIGVNDKDEAVGMLVNRKAHEQHGFVLRNGRGSLLPTPKGFPLSVASSINNRGEISGDVTQGANPDKKGQLGQAARWIGNNVEVLTHSGASTTSTGLLGDGTVIGLSGLQRCLPGNIFELGLRKENNFYLPFSASAPTARVLGVAWLKGKKDAKIVGEFYPLAASPNGTLACIDPRVGGTPMIWRNGKEIPLPAMAGYDLTMPYAVNDKGYVVGNAINRSQQRSQPVIWVDGKIMPLPLPEGGDGMVSTINARGDAAVGAIRDKAKKTLAATLWLANGKTVDLNTYLPKDTKAKLLVATCINDKGTIGGYAQEDGKVFGFLLQTRK
jgi:hypothetical protein